MGSKIITTTKKNPRDNIAPRNVYHWVHPVVVTRDNQKYCFISLPEVKEGNRVIYKIKYLNDAICSHHLLGTNSFHSILPKIVKKNGKAERFHNFLKDPHRGKSRTEMESRLWTAESAPM